MIIPDYLSIFIENSWTTWSQPSHEDGAHGNRGSFLCQLPYMTSTLTGLEDVARLSRLAKKQKADPWQGEKASAKHARLHDLNLRLGSTWIMFWPCESSQVPQKHLSKHVAKTPENTWNLQELCEEIWSMCKYCEATFGVRFRKPNRTAFSNDVRNINIAWAVASRRLCGKLFQGRKYAKPGEPKLRDDLGPTACEMPQLLQIQTVVWFSFTAFYG